MENATIPSQHTLLLSFQLVVKPKYEPASTNHSQAELTTELTTELTGELLTGELRANYGRTTGELRTELRANYGRTTLRTRTELVPNSYRTRTELTERAPLSSSRYI